MAADHCADAGLELASLSEETLAKLDAALPAAWSRNNPIDVLGDAGPDRYEAAVQACLEDPQIDAALVILTPQAQTAPREVAKILVRLRKKSRKPILACWMGAVSVKSSRALFKKNNIPHYGTPEAAVRAFAALAAYNENQQHLLQVPELLIPQSAPAIDNASMIIDNVLADGRRILNQAESKAVLAAFRIPIIQSLPVDSAQEAMLVAQEMGFPVAMKIDSPDITHKTDVGGVRLGLVNARQVQSVFKELTESVTALKPDARINGVVIEPMWKGRHGRELMVGVIRDEVFGPVLSFGLGGTMVEVIRDRAVSLTPLNPFLAKRLVNRTKAAKMLEAVRGSPAADRAALESLLLRVSEMACELPAIVEMDMNPVIASADGVVAVDARIVVAPYNESARAYDHMAIHPYPRDLVQHADLAGGTRITIRPIRPEDAIIERDFLDGLSERSRYFRFMYSMQNVSPDMLSRFTQIDYDREMALIATVEADGKEEQIGVARYSTMLDPGSCEFAIVVGDDWQNKGLARRLMRALIEAARARRYTRMIGMVLKENHRMIEFSKSIGFKTEPNPDDRDLVDVVLDL